MSKIVLENFNEGNGSYKVNLAYLNEEQVKEIEGLVKKWNPELKESEDEKIRKALIKTFNELKTNQHINGVLVGDILTWLEKQGKQVSAIRWYDASFIPQEMKELLVEWNSSDATWHDVAFYHADTKTFWNYERELKNVTRWCYVDDLFEEQSNVKETGISQHDKKTCVENESSLTDKPQGKSALEAINEEKVDNANKVEHKFNEGDWIVNRENKIVQIKALKKDKYNVLRYCIEWKDGKKTNPLQYYTDNYCHLWILSDVKNGDILYSPSHHLIWIYKDNETAHVCVNMNYVKDNVFTEGLIVIPEDACPANKLQRDILFSKIKEAGYEWDADKKELKKIEQKSVEWSEEDKNLLKLSFENLTELKDRYGEEYGKVCDCISWLKSLKDRCTWRPSDEQMEAFENFVRGIWESCYDSPYENKAKLLYSLLEQLKKLK